MTQRPHPAAVVALCLRAGPICDAVVKLWELNESETQFILKGSGYNRLGVKGFVFLSLSTIRGLSKEREPCMFQSEYVRKSINTQR